VGPNRCVRPRRRDRGKVDIVRVWPYYPPWSAGLTGGRVRFAKHFFLRCQLARYSYVCGLAFVLGTLASGGSFVIAENPTLALDVARRNQTTVESIHTLTCKYKTKRYGGDGKLLSQSAEVQYFRRGTTFRSQWRDGQKMCETVIDGFQARSTGVLPAGGRVTTVAPYDGLPLAAGDPWVEANLTFIGSWKRPPMPVFFSELVEYPGVKVTAASEGEMVVVQIESPGGKSRGRYWLDPRKNYLIQRVESTAVGAARSQGKIADAIVETNVERFAEPTRGIFFPATYTRTTRAGAEVQSRELTEIKSLQINGDLPADIFTLRANPKDHVIDHIQGRRFVIGADGKTETLSRPILPSTPSQGAPVELTETKSEPRLLPAWLLPASLACVLLGGLTWVVRRRRSAIAGRTST
jgi:hypothetical protein